MATNRVVRKQLACEEDILFGVGSVNQTRNGADYALNKITVIAPVDTTVERDALDTDHFLYSSVAGVQYAWDGAAWISLAPAAADVVFTPYGDIAATTVQGAIEELEDEKADALHNHDTDYVGKDSDVGSADLPVGTTAERTAGPSAGLFRFNTDLLAFEGYDGSAWGSVGGGARGAVSNSVFYENDQNVTGDYTITAGKNAMSTGPLTIDSGVTVTVPSGSTWVIL